MAKRVGVGIAIVLAVACIAAIAFHERLHEAAMPQRMLEIRSYDLKPGSRAAFHGLVGETIPMLLYHGIDVVAYGPSAHDTSSYVLVRAFPSLAERDRLEASFYGSAEWRSGPRDRVLAMIDHYTTIVLPLDSTMVERLRTSLQPLNRP